MDLNFLQQSGFLSALGNAIVQSIWQSFLLWILFEIIVIGTKNITAKSKHNLSVALVCASFTLFAYTFIEKLFSPEIATVPVVVNDPNPGVVVSSLNELLLQTFNILPFLSFAYLLLLGFLLGKLIAAYRHVSFFANKNFPDAPAHLQSFALRVAEEIRIPQRIRIWISNHIEVPATIGFLKPVILIPLSSINHLSVNQLEAIILHELSHIKRNDYLINLVISVIETALFFNPFIAIFVKNIRKERENCCDDFVLQYKYDAHSYASALLDLEKNRYSVLQLSLSAVSGKKQLFSRIKRMTGGQKPLPMNNYIKKLLALAMITGTLYTLNYVIPAGISKEKPTTVQKQESFMEEKKVVEDSEITSTHLNGPNTVPVAPEKKNSVSASDDRKNLWADEKESELSKIRSDNFTLNSAVDDPKLKLDVRIDYKQIGEALQIAYQEINRIDWSEIQNNINKSLSDLKKNTSSIKDHEMELIFKNIPKIKIDPEQFLQLTNIQKFTIQQSIQDSLQAAGFILKERQATKLAETHLKKWEKLLKDSVINFSFNYEANGKRNQVFEINSRQKSKRPR